jgi:hypothetical protein
VAGLGYLGRVLCWCTCVCAVHSGCRVVSHGDFGLVGAWAGVVESLVADARR